VGFVSGGRQRGKEGHHVCDVHGARSVEDIFMRVRLKTYLFAFGSRHIYARSVEDIERGVALDFTPAGLKSGHAYNPIAFLSGVPCPDGWWHRQLWHATLKAK
jgi:hypothetical protein